LRDAIAIKVKKEYIYYVKRTALSTADHKRIIFSKHGDISAATAVQYITDNAT